MRLSVLLTALLVPTIGCNTSNPNAAAEAADLAARQAAWDKAIATPPEPVAEPEPPDGKPRAALLPAISTMRAKFETLGVGAFKAAPLSDGTPRLMGQSSDALTIVELIGYSDRLERMSVAFAMSKDSVQGMFRNTGAIMVAMEETGWKGGHQWAIAAIGKPSTTKRHGRADYRMQTIADTGICVLSVSPAH